MTTTKKTALIAALVAGTALATTAFAEMGPYGGDGHGGHGPKFLEMFDVIDTDMDGKLSLDELAAHRAAEFSAADTNGDGALDAEELSARMLARVQERLAERSQHILDTRDNDGNGALSLAEMGKGPGENHFARIDADNDGAISKDEAEAAMQHRKKRGHGWGMDDAEN